MLVSSATARTCAAVGLLLVLLMPGPAWAGKKELAKLQVVSLQSIPSERQPKLLTRSAAYGAGIGGLIGAAVAQAGEDEDDAFAALVKREGIDAEAAFSAAFRNQLMQRSILQVVDGAGAADAVIELETHLSVTPWQKKYMLGLAATIKIVDAKGKTIWKRSEWTRGSKEIPVAELQEFLTNADLVRAHLELAAGEVAKVLASQIYVARM